jgi:hypothetical protein
MSSAALPSQDRPIRAGNRLGLRVAGIVTAEAASEIFTLI